MRTTRFAPIFLSVLVLGWAGATQAAEHPSVLFDAEDIPTIQARLAGPLRIVREALEAGIHFPFAGGNFPSTPDLDYEHFQDRRGPPDSLLAFAFGATFLDPDTQIGQEARILARNYLLGICRYPDWVFAASQEGTDPDLNSAHHLFAVSLAYDWMYPTLSEEERDLCRRRVAVEGEKVYQAMLRNVWWMTDSIQNHNWINTSSLGLAALTFEGELDGVDTGRWLAAVQENLEKVHAIADLVEGGAWHEGPGYLNYGFDSLIPFSVALVRKKGGPDYADNHAVRDFPTLRRFMMPPVREKRREFGFIWGNFSGIHNENTLLSTFYTASKHRDHHAAWYAQKYVEGAIDGREGFLTWPPAQRGVLLATLLYDETVTPAPPAEDGAAWELDYFAKDLSLWVSRTSWRDGGGLVGLKSGVFGGHGNFNRLAKGDDWPGGFINFGHNHADDNGFYYFADGEWLTVPVPGYWIGRNDSNPQANRTKYANSLLIDGDGQLGEGVRTCHMRSCPWFFERIGSIPTRGSTANFSFAVGAGSQLYPKHLQLQTFGRSVLFVDRRIPVIRDVVRAAEPHRYEITFHAIDGVARDGDWLRLEAKNGRAAALKVVAPQNFALRTERQSLVHTNKFDPDGSMTAAMIRPQQDAREAVFLTALAPVRTAAWQTRPSIEPLDPDAPHRGLVLSGLEPDEVYEILFTEDPSHVDDTPSLGISGMVGVKKTRGDAIVRLLVAAGHSLRVDGETWVEILDPGHRTLEVDYTEEGVRISGDAHAFRVRAPDARRVWLNGQPVDFLQDGAYVVYPAPEIPDEGDDGDGAGGSGGEGGGDEGDPSDPQPGCGGGGGTGGPDGEPDGKPGDGIGPGGDGPQVPGPGRDDGASPRGSKEGDGGKCSAAGPWQQASPLAFAWLSLFGLFGRRRAPRRPGR